MLLLALLLSLVLLLLLLLLLLPVCWFLQVQLATQKPAMLR